MIPHNVVSSADWHKARQEFLVKEKEFTRLRDELSQQRRELPWVKVEQDYTFDGPNGAESLSDLFGDKSQLIVQHFMYGPDWGDRACASCSFWADGYNGFYPHIHGRDAAFVAVSLAPLEKINAYKEMMGWDFKWVSSSGSSFNHDFSVTFSQEEVDAGTATYNYQPQTRAGESPGTSIFYKDEEGTIYHTYSTYARGLDMMNAAYHYMDLLPKGRDEDGLPWSMAWLKYRDQY